MKNPMEPEVERVRRMMAGAIRELETEGGDLRCFTAALLGGAFQLYAEVEGTAALNRAVVKIASRLEGPPH